MVAKYSPGKYSDDPVAACEADEKLRLVKDVFDNVLKQEVFFLPFTFFLSLFFLKLL